MPHHLTVNRSPSWWYGEPVALDVGIEPLVVAIWDAGWYTTSSCQGPPFYDKAIVCLELRALPWLCKAGLHACVDFEISANRLNDNGALELSDYDLPQMTAAVQAMTARERLRGGQTRLVLTS